MIYYQEAVCKSTYYNTFCLSTPTTATVRDGILKEVDKETWRIVSDNVSDVVRITVRESVRGHVWASVEEYFKKKRRKK